MANPPNELEKYKKYRGSHDYSADLKNLKVITHGKDAAGKATKKTYDCSTAGKNYKSTRDSEFFADATIADNPLDDAAIKTPGFKAFSKSITDKLTLDPETTAALQLYTAEITRLKSELNKTPPEPQSVRKAIGELHTLKGIISAEIKKQHDSETPKLDSFLNDEANIDNFITASNFPTDTPKDTIRDDIKQHLQTRQSNQINAFEESINQVITEFHRVNQIDVARIAFLNDRYNESTKWYQGKVSDNKKEIDALRRALEDSGAIPPVPTGLSVGNVTIDAESAMFQGIKVKDLAKFKSITGKNITKSNDGNTYSLKISSKKWFLLEHSPATIEKDMQSLAEIVRACGFTSIKFTISHHIREQPPEQKQKDEAFANMLLRKAYTASIKAGFKPEDIVVVLNGKEHKGPALRQLIEGQGFAAELEEADIIAEEKNDTYKQIESEALLDTTQKTDYTTRIKSHLDALKTPVPGGPPQGRHPAGTR